MEYRTDRNLYLAIPILALLMAMIMRVDGSRVLSFFGLFGVMSVIRFHLDMTDQKARIFILFSVIEGVIRTRVYTSKLCFVLSCYRDLRVWTRIQSIPYRCHDYFG